MSETAGRRTARVTLPPAATSPARARQFVTATLDEWGAHGADNLLLVVSELVTNGLLHARTPMTVELREEGADLVRLAVTDGSRQPLQERRFSLDSGTGRGLRLLAALSTDWGVEWEAGGKVVWCRVALGDAAEEFGDFDFGAVEAL